MHWLYYTHKTFSGQLFLLLLIVILFGCRKGAISLTSLSTINDSISMRLAPVPHPINALIGGYYVGLPSNYSDTHNSYPLLIYVPGAGQFGNGSLDLPLLLNDGVAELIDENRFPATFHVKGATFSFIVISPQCKDFPSPTDINDCLQLALKTYRVDTTRIYLSGLSVGSIVSCDLAAQIPQKVAALVAMSGVPLDYASTGKCDQIAKAGLPVWAFHNDNDPEINIEYAKGFISSINAKHPAIPARLTIWASQAHDAWTKALDPNYKENGQNIYEWMLSYQR